MAYDTISFVALLNSGFQSISWVVEYRRMLKSLTLQVILRASFGNYCLLNFLADSVFII
jgi:hypothetical protein